MERSKFFALKKVGYQILTWMSSVNTQQQLPLALFVKKFCMYGPYNSWHFFIVESKWNEEIQN